MMDMANSCLLACECDNGSRTPVHHCGTLKTFDEPPIKCWECKESAYREQHICHVLLYGASIRNHVDRLAHADALASEDGLVDPEATRGYGQDSAIRWNFVTDCNRNDVTWNKFGGMNAGQLARPEDFSLIWGIFLQSLHEHS